MQDIGLEWNNKKCSVMVRVKDSEGFILDEPVVVKCLEDADQYKFLVY